MASQIAWVCRRWAPVQMMKPSVKVAIPLRRIATGFSAFFSSAASRTSAIFLFS
jgi:hypothetical protein